MAMTTCSDCDKPVSENADVCPYCGCVFNEKSIFAPVFGAIIAASVVLAVLGAVISAMLGHR
jgi:hypothetical protein